MARNPCATININNRFTETTILCPIDLTSNENISLGTNHPNGPHDHENPTTYMQIITNSKYAYPFEMLPSPEESNLMPKIIAIITYTFKQH